MKAYRLKIENKFLSGTSIQVTSDRYTSLMTLERAESYLKMIPEATLETVTLDEMIPCKTSKMTFGVGDTFGHELVESVIIYQTAKYVYTAQLDANEVKLHTIEKHKKSDMGSIDFNTRQGYKV